MKHDIWIQNMDGTLSRMDEPFFQSRPIAPGTWQILSEGDYWYLVEGDREAMLIDAGQGAGNPRAYAQTLTKKPIRYVANTHFHFDHTANDGYFDRAFMSAGTRAGLPEPGPSFQGVAWPKGYPIQVIEEGYTFHLGGRDLEAIMLGNHTPGGTAYLDRKQRILFSGDEIMGQQGMRLNVTVEQFQKLMAKLAAHRGEYDTLAAGWEKLDAVWIDKYLALANYILAGHEGTPVAQAEPAPLPNGWKQNASAPKGPNGTPVFFRHVPRNGGGIPAPGQAPAPGSENMVRIFLDGATLTYDRTKVRG
jgi:glyoxylase-like metal-dependent hydrolase (beta-lactamase superfamily II)